MTQHENHPLMKSVAHACYKVPGMKNLARRLGRFIIRRQFLSYSNRKRIFNFLTPDVLPKGDTCFQVRTGARRLRLKYDLSDDVACWLYYWDYDGYEIGVKRLWVKLLQTHHCVFDIGANIGYYSLLAGAVRPDVDVHAFEPRPEIFQRFQDNVLANQLENVHINDAAVCDVDGSAALYFTPGEALSNASLRAGFMNQLEKRQVHTVRFDTYCREHRLTSVDLVKMDCEGAEILVLKGMGDLLEAWMPDIICEVLPEFQEELEAFFARTPYRRYLITDNGLEARDALTAHPMYRDYFLSCRTDAL